MMILTKAEIQQELLIYGKNIKKNMVAEVAMVTITVLLLFSSVLLLCLIAAENVPENYYIGVAAILGFFIMVLTILSIFWYVKQHKDAQIHMPIVPKQMAIDISATLINLFNYLCAIFAVFLPQMIHHFRYEDAELVVFTIQSSLIFFFWGVLYPIAASMVRKHDEVAALRFMHYDVNEVKKYLAYLKKVYNIRRKRFDKELPIQLAKHSQKFIEKQKDNPRWQPIGNKKFSFDTRRAFRDVESKKYTNEYFLFKFIIFCDLFEYIYKNIPMDNHEFYLNLFIRSKNKKVAHKFYKHVNRHIKKLKKGIANKAKKQRAL